MKQRQAALKKWYKTAQGQAVAGCVGARVDVIWQNIKGAEILVIGGEGLPFAAFSGARVTHITGQRAEESLPFADKAFDYIFVAHTLEFLGDEEALLAECARCLVPSGKVLIMVANRLSAWARAGETPFGVGQPYSCMQVRAALITAELTVAKEESAVFFPPLKWRWVVRTAPKFESFGRVLRPWAKLCGMVGGGVLLVEGVKQVVGGTPSKLKARRVVPKLRPAYGSYKNSPSE